MEDIALRDLKIYYQGAVLSLEIDTQFLKLTEAEIDARLDRINEIKEMIVTLESKKGK